MSVKIVENMKICINHLLRSNSVFFITALVTVACNNSENVSEKERRLIDDYHALIKLREEEIIFIFQKTMLI